jgi:hypothetical protein
VIGPERLAPLGCGVRLNRVDEFDGRARLAGERVGDFDFE